MGTNVIAKGMCRIIRLERSVRGRGVLREPERVGNERQEAEVRAKQPLSRTDCTEAKGVGLGGPRL